MWPFDRKNAREVVRIGRAAVERWSVSRAGFELLGVHALPANLAPAAQDLTLAITALYGQSPNGQLADIRPAQSQVTLVLESAWSPAVLVDTGGRLLGPAQLQALVRHRLGLLHGQFDDPVSNWQVRIDHRAGERHALAYGMSLRLKESLMAAGQAVGIGWDAMTPAFDWGRRQLGSKLRPHQTRRKPAGWHVLAEQDRMLAGYAVAGRIVGLHPALLNTTDSKVVVGQIQAEEVRLGIAANASPIWVTHWERVRPPWREEGGRVIWHGLSSSESDAPQRNAALDGKRMAA